MQIAPVPVDPATSIVRAAAHASLQALRDDVAAARSASAAARDAVPSTTLDWFGPASDALGAALERLLLGVDDVRVGLDASVALLDGVLP